MLIGVIQTIARKYFARNILIQESAMIQLRTNIPLFVIVQVILQARLQLFKLLKKRMKNPLFLLNKEMIVR